MRNNCTTDDVCGGRLHIALCFTDQSGDYHKHALVTMTSVLEHTSCPVSVHILHDDTLLPNVGRFESTAARYGQRVFFHNLEEVDFSRLMPFVGKWGKGALFRLLVHDHVPADRVLYLDCDIVVMRDLAELLTLDMGGAVIAAVTDEPSAVIMGSTAIRRLGRLGINPADYFNTGFMFMDAARLRKAGGDYIAAVAGYMAAGTTTYPDQDALNMYFAKRPGQVMFIDGKFNQQIGYALLDTYIQPFDWYAGRVIHFTGPKKPWRYFSQAALLYWKYYAMAFPEENIMSCIMATDQHKYNALCIFFLASPKLRGLVRRMRDLEAGGLWYAIGKRLFPK